MQESNGGIISRYVIQGLQKNIWIFKPMDQCETTHSVHVTSLYFHLTDWWIINNSYKWVTFLSTKFHRNKNYMVLDWKIEAFKYWKWWSSSAGGRKEVFCRDHTMNCTTWCKTNGCCLPFPRNSVSMFSYLRWERLGGRLPTNRARFGPCGSCFCSM